MRVLLLHNSGAGQGDMPKEALINFLESAGHSVVYRSTKTDAIDPDEARAADARWPPPPRGEGCRMVGRV